MNVAFGDGGHRGVEVFYHEHAFVFEPSPGETFAGRLVLNHRQRELLAALTAAEDECW